MPTYEYAFDDGIVVEVTQNITDDPITERTHPLSGQRLPVKKVYSAPGIVLKGRGFYRTGG
jgi:predicted nucleic acid-binding Zn ribbon protein